MKLTAAEKLLHQETVKELKGRAKRLYMARVVKLLGKGGQRRAEEELGWYRGTIRKGKQELESGFRCYDNFSARGRKRAEVKDPTIMTTLEKLVENEIAGDPMSEQKWVRSSTHNLSKRLKEAGHRVSAMTVSRLLKDMGFSMKANTKRQIKSNSIGREEQFQYITSQRQTFTTAGFPIISVDAKKKELIGNFSNPGKTWRRQAEEVNQHDFPSAAVCRASPYNGPGILDTKNGK